MKTIYVLTFLAIFVLAGIVNVRSVYSPNKAIISVSPLIVTADVGSTFVIDIEIKNAENLYAFGFKFGWTFPLMYPLTISEGDFLESSGSTIFACNIGFSHVSVGCTLLGVLSGASGEGTLATVTFRVWEYGDCPLDIYDVTLLDNNLNLIDHDVEDGLFGESTEQLIYAKPKYHHLIFPIKGYYQTFYVKLRNIGKSPMLVKVKFKSYITWSDRFVGRVQPITVEVLSEDWLYPSEITTLSVSVQVVKPLLVNYTYKYHTEVTCWYSHYSPPVHWVQGSVASFDWLITNEYES